jgi:hypothetical protein
MSLKRIKELFGSVGSELVHGAPVTLETKADAQAPAEQTGDEIYADWWAHLGSVEPKDWDLEGFYQRCRRGQPVHPTPLIAIITPTYRETESIAKKGRQSRNEVREALSKRGIPSMVGSIDGDSLVCRMRQRACHLFLSSAATHLLFWDADLECMTPDCVADMIATGHDVIAAACPFKDMSGRTVHNLFPDDEGKPPERDEHGCVEVQDAGTGFLLIARDALIRLQKAHPELLHISVSRSNDRGAPLWALFDTAVIDGVYASEDYHFCHLWQQLDGKVYVWPSAVFRHWGEWAAPALLMRMDPPWWAVALHVMSFRRVMR